MTIAYLTPDKTLATLLDGKVKVRVSETQSRAVLAYAQAEQPQEGLGREFITLTSNGAVESLTERLGVLRGDIAMMIYCKTNPDGTANRPRIASIIDQAVKLVDRKSVDGIFFELNPTSVIVPTTTNLSNGYATTVLNVMWRATNV